VTIGHRRPTAAEEQAILDTISLVNLDDGFGNLIYPTVRFTVVNVQVVNGLGATNGNSNNPGTLTNTNVNGVGNLIVGSNELGNPVVGDRTGIPQRRSGHGQQPPELRRPGGRAGQHHLGSVRDGQRRPQNQAKGGQSSVSGG
jgi:hypothetical protein